MRGIYWLAESRLALQEGLRYTELEVYLEEHVFSAG